jgi:hypothetical protein
LAERDPPAALVADPDVGAVAVGDHGPPRATRQRAAHQGLDGDVGDNRGARDLEPQRSQLGIDAAGQRIVARDGEEHHARRTTGGIGGAVGAFGREDGDE